MADLTFVSKQDNLLSSATPYGTCPINVQEGDLLIACAVVRNANPAVYSTGFTAIHTATGNGDTSLTGRPLVAYKIVTASDTPGTTYQFDNASRFNSSVSIAAYRSAIPYTLITGVTTEGNTTANGSSTTLSSGTVTATAASGTIIVCGGTNTGLNNELCTYSSTMNERCDSHQANGDFSRCQTGIFDKIGTAVAVGSNAFEAITQSRSETWGRIAFILDFTYKLGWRGSNNPRVMG